MTVLQAYFDESERSGLLVVAGYAFASDQARKLKREFDAIFGPYGGLHMKHLIHGQGKYRGVSQTERDELLKIAVEIIRRRFSYGCYVALNTHDFEACAPKSVRGFRAAYPFCCYLAMFALLRVMRAHGDLSQVHYVFEAGHALQSSANYIVSIASMPGFQPFFHYSGHSFTPKTDATPLQAADLLAWEAGKFKVETLDREEREIRKSLLTLLQVDPKRYSVHHLEGEKLQRHLTRIESTIGDSSIEEMIFKAISNRINRTKNSAQ